MVSVQRWARVLFFERGKHPPRRRAAASRTEELPSASRNARISMRRCSTSSGKDGPPRRAPARAAPPGVVVASRSSDGPRVSALSSALHCRLLARKLLAPGRRRRLPLHLTADVRPRALLWTRYALHVAETEASIRAKVVAGAGGYRVSGSASRARHPDSAVPRFPQS